MTGNPNERGQTMDPMLIHDARMVVTQILQIQEGETVTVFTDHRRRDEAEAVALAAEEARADVIVVDIGRQVRELLTGDEFFIPPARHVLGAMEGSTAGIFVVDETYAFRLDHKIYQVTETAQDRSFFSIDPGMGTWGLTAADLALVKERGDRLHEAIEGGDQIHVTSRGGTDLTLSIEGRECLYVTPIPWRGLASVYPVPLWGELNWAPIEDSAAGTVVIDGLSEATERIKDVAAPVTWTVKEGRVTDVRGTSADAEEWRAVFAIDEGAAVVGEFGVGANHKAIRATQSEKALLGTIHLGMGENKLYPGGRNRSKAHVDGGVLDVSIEVDGRVVVNDGAIVI
jgi:leucyl aminopeptidase (aminopeptidase T)